MFLPRHSHPDYDASLELLALLPIARRDGREFGAAFSDIADDLNLRNFEDVMMLRDVARTKHGVSLVVRHRDGTRQMCVRRSEFAKVLDLAGRYVDKMEQ